MNIVTISGTRRQKKCSVSYRLSSHPKMKWMATATIDGQEFAPVLVEQSPNMTAAGRLIDKILAVPPRGKRQPIKTAAPDAPLKIH